MPRPVAYRAPFDQDGNLLHYVYTSAYTRAPGEASGLDWRPVEPFTATLTIETMHSGRSAKYLEWRDPDGHRYPMFVADLLAMLREAVIDHGTLTASWLVRKRGENYGIRLAAPQP